ncbi:hypothetical protein [Methylobacterium sp. A54F]
MNNHLQEGPLSPVSPAPSHDLAPQPLSPKALPPQKLTRREERRRRRKRRRRGEEILAWFLVPAIILGIYWSVTAGLDLLGTSPGQVWDQLMQVKAMMEKRSS